MIINVSYHLLSFFMLKNFFSHRPIMPSSGGACNCCTCVPLGHSASHSCVLSQSSRKHLTLCTRYNPACMCMCFEPLEHVHSHCLCAHLWKKSTSFPAIKKQQKTTTSFPTFTEDSLYLDSASKSSASFRSASLSQRQTQQ